jgi:pantoate--beta-alanine ligase
VELIESATAFRSACEGIRAEGRTLGLVPTMGSFHEGHLSLMRRARQQRDAVAVSIFVNPLQFGPGEDFASYPRDLTRDLELAASSGVDLVLAPSVEEMYGGGSEVTVDPGPLGDRLEGAIRPGHFRGVLTVVAKLLHLARPSAAYFGEKDWQQLQLVRRMVVDLSFWVEVVGCPIIREADGLAMSSRNVYLSPEERRAAACLFRALRVAEEDVRSGDRDALRALDRMADAVHGEPLATLDYVVIVDEETFQDVDEIRRPARALVAARIGRPRLIDNIRLVP